MTGELVVDYSFARPDPAAIVAAGYSGAARYLAPLPNPKVIVRAELEQLHAAGLAVVLVWETTAHRASAGRDAGAADARAADAQAHELGLPLDRPIYFAVDYDAEPAAVLEYFRGAGTGTPHPVGVYGSRRVVDELLAAELARYGWQTVAWSHGQLSAGAHLYQRLTATVPHPVPGTDENVALQADYGQWPPPAPDPTPTEDDDMAVLIRTPSDGKIWCLSGAGRWHIKDATQELPLIEWNVIRGNHVETLKPEQEQAFLLVPEITGGR